MRTLRSNGLPIGLARLNVPAVTVTLKRGPHTIVRKTLQTSTATRLRDPKGRPAPTA